MIASHRYKYLLLACLLFALQTGAQTSSENYVRQNTALNSQATQAVSQVQYYDGFGRPTILAAGGLASDGSYLYTQQTYDGKSRPQEEWLPYKGTSTPDFITGSQLKSLSSSFNSDSHPYSRKAYDALDRVTSVEGIGSAWQGHAASTVYGTNNASSVRHYIVATAGSTISSGSYWPQGSLSKVTATDEDGRSHTIYKDVIGNTVMEQDGTDSRTCFVYDDMNRLRYVLPPAASDALAASGQTWDISSTPALIKYAYYYEYDGRGRCVNKKLPGSERILMRYDRADRLVFSQDGNQREGNRCSFFLYDALGRLCVEGTCRWSDLPDIASLNVEATYTGTGTYGGYTTGITLSEVSLLAVNYYDDYSFVNIQDIAKRAGLAFQAVTGFASTSSSARGLPTGKRTYHLDGSGNYEVSSVYYDGRGNAIQTHQSNHLSGFEHEYTSYTHTQQPSVRKRIHSASYMAAPITETYTYTYESATDRLNTVKHHIGNGSDISLAAYAYDAHGRMGAKTVGGMETVSYTYNVRNWMTGISSANYAQTMAYNTAVDELTPPKLFYGGNISAMRWKTGNESHNRTYNFDYDEHSRLVEAEYSGSEGDYSSCYTYDKMGNQTEIMRRKVMGYSSVFIDDLTLEYDGNRLVNVQEHANPVYDYEVMNFEGGSSSCIQYEYDQNGNMVKDKNKSVSSITYNSLNLPSRIEFGQKGSTQLLYDADGRKLNVLHTVTSYGNTKTVNTDYCGNVVYENGALKRILIDGGYVTMSGQTPVYHYYLQDHLGNNRVVLSQAGTIEQVTHYYPFGTVIAASTNGESQPYKYNGKELDRMNGLDWYDYGARFYDPVLCRWHVMDPLCEKDYGISPYAYCENDPVNAIDTDGRSGLKVLLKGAYKLGKTVAKQGLSSLSKGATYTTAFHDVIEDTKTVLDSNAPTEDRLLAGGSLLSEIFSPVSIKEVKTIINKTKSFVHGNSKLSTKAQHIYRIFDNVTGKTVKVGISGGKISSKTGRSYRATTQVNKWNKGNPNRDFDSEILEKVPAGKNARNTALEREKQYAEKYRDELEDIFHKRP